VSLAAQAIGDETEMPALKKANALVREIGMAVQPPQDIPIVLTEDPGAMPNWVAAAGIMEAALTGKFSEKAVEFRNLALLLPTTALIELVTGVTCAPAEASAKGGMRRSARQCRPATRQQ